MDYQSLPSQSIDASPSPSHRRRSSTRRRVRSLNSPRSQNLHRTANSAASTPKATRRSAHNAGQSSIMNSSLGPRSDNDHVLGSIFSPIRASNSSHRSPPPVPSQIFDCQSDEEQRPKRSVSTTTRSGRMKKDAVLSYFTIRPDERYDCNICHQVSSTCQRILQGDDFSIWWLTLFCMERCLCTLMNQMRSHEIFNKRVKSSSSWNLAQESADRSTGAIVPSVSYTSWYS